MRTFPQKAGTMFSVLCGILLSACGTLPPLDPEAHESKTVSIASDTSKNITVPEGMVWYAGPSRSMGIRLPPGLYSLEAEDADYWYFRSSAPLEFRSFENGIPTEEHSSPGGLMLGKRSLRMVPAGAYIEGEGTSKIMVWKLGGDFLAMEGKQWRKSF